MSLFRNHHEMMNSIHDEESGYLFHGVHYPYLHQPNILPQSINGGQTSITDDINHHYHHNNHHGNHHHQRNPLIERSQCVVCSDRARGCNFGAITCASCKEFFRRNAFKLKNLKCYFKSKCEINIYSRRFCAACRLARCYQMGMKSEYIMSEAAKYERNMKIIKKKLNLLNYSKNYDHINQMNRINSMNESPCQTFNEYEFNSNEKFTNSNIVNYYSQAQQSVDLGFNETILINMVSFHPVDHLTSQKNNNHLNNCSKFNKKIQTNYNLEDSETVIKLLKKVKIIRESGYSLNKFNLLLRAKDMNRQLTEHGSCKLKYLTSIVQILSAEIFSDLPTDQKFIDLIRIAEIVTFNFIKMYKKLYAFQALSQEDQVALVKGGVVDTLMIWSMMTINLEKECWEALDLERNFRFSLKMEMLKEANPKLYEKHRSYVMSYEPEWRYDDNLMSLLIAIALFNPERPNLSNVEMISNERNAYCNLLKLYLQMLYEESTSNKMYRRLLNQLKLTETISEYHMKAYFDLNTNEANKKCFGGLIIEIFDLNN